MTARTLALWASATCLSAALCSGAATADTPAPVYEKIKTTDSKLKEKSGYWTECHYSSTYGEVCEYVYAGDSPQQGASAAPASEMKRVKVGESKFKEKSGYWVECRYSATYGEVCEYVYMQVK